MAIPYIPANLKEAYIVPAMQIIGTKHERYPKASPWIILIAAPETQDSARF
jgi:hypothetical protein